MSQYATNEQIILAARKRLDQNAWDYVTGGAESETTMRRNRLAFDRWALRPRILRDVSQIDTSTTLLGQKLRIPVLLAPIGSLQLFEPGGGATVGQAAADFGTIQVVSSQTQPRLEETAVAGDAAKIFQLYVLGDLAWCREIIGRARAAGYRALVLTVDMAFYGRRERPLLNNWAAPTRRGGGAQQQFLTELSWEKMAAIREMWGDAPFGLKGVATAEDARIAVDQGVDIIWVSNHGGRQMDHSLGSLDVLPEVVEAARGKATVLVDGGVQRGTDVIKALALGADAVAIGKLLGWGLAAGGREGVVRVLEILENEIVSAMGLLGVTSLDELGPAYLARAEAVSPPHEMSGWVNMRGGRVL